MNTQKALINTTLLITGAIDIESNLPFKTILTNTQNRLEQYIHSILYAIENYSSVDKIVFCDNTNYLLKCNHIFQIAQSKNKQLEILAFAGNTELLKEKGKGYGEGEIISYCLNNSELLKECNMFIKLTGRLCIDNFDKLFDVTSNQNIFMLDNVVHKKKIQVSTVLYKVNVEFYKQYLSKCYLEVCDTKGYYLEHAFGNVLTNKKVLSFCCLPHVIGVAGSSGDLYYNSFRKKLYFNLGLLQIKKGVFASVNNCLYSFIKDLYSFISKAK
jgi:hypothetical protein